MRITVIHAIAHLIGEEEPLNIEEFTQPAAVTLAPSNDVGVFPAIAYVRTVEPELATFSHTVPIAVLVQLLVDDPDHASFRERLRTMQANA